VVVAAVEDITVGVIEEFEDHQKELGKRRVTTMKIMTDQKPMRNQEDHTVVVAAAVDEVVIEEEAVIVDDQEVKALVTTMEIPHKMKGVE